MYYIILTNVCERLPAPANNGWILQKKWVGNGTPTYLPTCCILRIRMNNYNHHHQHPSFTKCFDESFTLCMNYYGHHILINSIIIVVVIVIACDKRAISCSLFRFSPAGCWMLIELRFTVAYFMRCFLQDKLCYNNIVAQHYILVYNVIHYTVVYNVLRVASALCKSILTLRDFF